MNFLRIIQSVNVISKLLPIIEHFPLGRYFETKPVCQHARYPLRLEHNRNLVDVGNIMCRDDRFWGDVAESRDFVTGFVD